MQPDLQNQVALVTGAGRGIGKAIALALAAQGAHVYLAARSEGELTQLSDQITAAGGQATAVRTDLTSEPEVLRLFQRISTSSGRLDILINNAGIGFFGPVHTFPVEQLDQIFAVNVRGTFLCSRESLKLMLPRRSGVIISVSSVVGFRGYPNQAAYAASKHAVMGLTKSMAADYQKDGIRIAAILPGGVDTEMVGSARPDLNRAELIHTDQIAQTVLYLLGLSTTTAWVDQIYIRRKTSAPF